MKPNQSNPLFSRLPGHQALAAAIVVTLTGFAVPPSAQAANQTYQDANILNTWNTSDANWDAGVVWTNANSAIFGGTAESVAVGTVTANGITFNSAGYTLTGGTITLGAAPTPISLTANATIASAIAGGTNGLTKTGAGTLTLSGAQTYTGNITLSGASSMKFASGFSTTAATAAISLQGGVSPTNILTIESGATANTKYLALGDSSGASSRVDQTGGSVVVNTAGNNFRVGHWDNGANSGSVYNLSGGTLDTKLATATVSHDGTADVNVGGGAGTATWQAGILNFDAGGADTKVGRVNLLSNGVLEVNAAVGTSNSGAALEGIHLAGGTLKVGTASTTNATLYADSNSTIDANGLTLTLTGGITGTSSVNLSAATGTVSFSTSGTQSITAPLTGSTAITKVGTGTTTFSAATNSHSGNLTVSAGRLNVSGSLASTVTVSSGATLSAAGSLTSPSSATVAGTLLVPGTMSSPASVSSGGTLNVSGTVSSNVSVAGGGTITGEGGFSGTTTPASGALIGVDPSTTTAATFNNLNLTGQPSISFISQPTPAQNPVKLFSYTGTLTSPNGIATDLLINGLTNYRTGVITDTAGVVTLNIGNLNLVWDGSGGTQWDLKTSSRWNSGASVFAWGDAVTFNDTSTGANVTLTGELQPSTITVNSSVNNYTITGSAGNFISGAGSLLKSGTSTLTMNGPNTFTGGVTLSQGTIQIQSAGALGAGTVTIGDASTGSNPTSLYIDTNRVVFVRPIIVSALGTGTVTLGTRANVGGTGAGNGFAGITLNRDVVFDSNAADRTDYSGISGTGNVTVGGAGRTVFSAANSFVGNLTINSITDANGLQLGTNSTAFNAIPDASSVTVNAGGKLSLSYTAAGSETINGLNGAGKVRNNGGNANILVVGGANGSGSFSGTIENGGGTISLTKNGTGTQVLNGTNTYTGVTTISGGILQFGTLASLYNNTPASWTATNLTVASGATAAFNVGGAGEFSSTDLDTLRVLSNVVSGTSATTGFKSGSSIGVDTTNAPGGTFTYASIIANHVAGATTDTLGVTKLGTGTLILSGASTYTGTTNVNAGTLEVTANSGGKPYVVAPAATLRLGYSTGDSVYGYGVTVNGAGTAATTGLYLNGGAIYTLTSTLNLATAPTTVRGYGTGSATLSGWDSNFTHLTVTAAASGSVIDSNVNFKPGGFGYVMNIAAGANTATGDITFQGPLTGAVNGNNAAFRKVGAGSLLLTGAGSNSALVDIRDGSVILGGGANRIGSAAIVNLGSGTTSGKLVLGGNDQTLGGLTTTGTGTTNKVVGASPTLSALAINNAAAGTFAGTLGGTGTDENNLSLAKSGIGTLTLTGTNTYTGGTTLSGGTLALGSAGAVGTTGTITMNGGTLQFSAANTTDFTATGRLKLEDFFVSNFDTNGQNVTFTGSISLGTSSNGGIGKIGAGTLTVKADQSFTGETVVTAGTLALDYSVANGSKLPDTGLLTLAGGTLSLSGGSHPEVVSDTEVTGNSVIARTSGTATINLGNITRTGANTLNILGDNIARTTMSNDISGKLPSWITVNGLPAANDGSGNIVAYAGFFNVFRLGGTFPSNPANNVKIVNGGTTGPVTPTSTGLTDISTLLQSANAGPVVVSLGASDTLRLGAVGAIQVPSTSSSLTIQGGSLTAGGAVDTDGEVAVDAGSDLTIGSAIVENGTGIVSLSKIGAGALTLSEANDFTGGITLNAGQLRIANALALGLGTLTINGGSLDNTSGSPIAIGDTIPQAWNADFSFAGSNDLEFNAGTVTLGANRTVTVANNLLGIGGNINGAFSLTKAGAGTLRVANGNWSGTTTVSAGTLEVLAKSTDVPYVVSSGATLKLAYATGGGYASTNLKITGDGTAALTGLYLKGGSSYNGSGTIQLLTAPTTIRQYGTGLASIGTFDINGDALTTVAAASGSVIDANIQMISRGFGMSVNIASGAATATGDLVINGPLNVGSLGFYKRGAGSLALNGAANPANAALQIQGGTVITGIADAIGATANLPISSGAKLVLNGFSQAAGTLSGAGSVVNASGTAAVLTITQAADQTFSGVLGGATANDKNFSLVKAGASKLTLTGANTYSGNTTVNAGTLSISTPFLANASDVRITTGATLDLTTATTDTIDELILDGSPQPAGVYGAVGSGAQFERSYITGNGTLTVTTGPAGYDSWLAGFTFPGGADTTRTGDPDGDGFTNLQEFLFGTSPVAGNGSLATTSISGNVLTIRWKQRVTGGTYRLLESATLANPWTLSGATPTNDGAAAGDYQPRKADVTIGAGSNFLRVEGVEN